MTKYIKNPARQNVVIPGRGAVRAGEVIEGNYDRYVPQLLLHAPATTIEAPKPALVVRKPAPVEVPKPAPVELPEEPQQPDTLPAPPDEPSEEKSVDDTVEISTDVLSDLVHKSGKKSGKKKR